MPANNNRELGYKGKDGFAERLNLFKDTLYYGLTNISDIFLLALFIFAGRYLGTDNFGVFSFSLSLAYIFSILTNFGLDPLAIREITRDKKNAAEYVGNILVLKSILSCLAFIALFAAVRLLKGEGKVLTVTCLLGVATFIRSFIASIRSFIQAFEKFKLETLLVITDRVTLFTFAVIGLITGKGIVFLAWIFVAVRVVTLTFGLLLLNKYIVKIKLRFSLKFITDFQLKALPFGFSWFCITVYTYIDNILISFMKTDADVGLYNSAYQIFLGLIVFSNIISMVSYPRLSRLFPDDMKRHLDLSRRAVKYMFLISLPLTAIGILYSEDIIITLFGRKYVEAAPVLIILLSGISFLFLNKLLSILLHSIDKEKFRMYTTLVGLAVRIFLVVLLIPFFGIAGAAFAAVGSELSRFIISGYYLHIKDVQISYLKLFWKPMLCLMMISVFIWNVKGHSLFFSLSLFVFLYCTSLFLVKVFDSYELEIVYNFFVREVFGKFKMMILR